MDGRFQVHGAVCAVKDGGREKLQRNNFNIDCDAIVIDLDTVAFDHG